jgi:hypothetical protein
MPEDWKTERKFTETRTKDALKAKQTRQRPKQQINESLS